MSSMTKADTPEKRQQAILKILHFIQDGGDLETAKAMFQESFDQVDVSEITSAERQLIAGGLDPSAIQYLCNVHVDLFRGNIKTNDENPDFSIPGHPVHTIKMENLVIKSLINDFLLPHLEKWEKQQTASELAKIRQALHDLATIDKHYSRKETSIFPIMNKYGITAPPQVMWGVDDGIRALIAKAKTLADDETPDVTELSEAIKQATHEVLEMIFKEEEIMLPMIDEVADASDWYNVKQEEKQIGYTLINPPMNWQPKLPKAQPATVGLADLSSLVVNFKEGSLNLKQIQAIIDLLPFALTFVDEHDRVAFFGGAASFYPHSKNVLGLPVFECHTAKSRPLIEKIFHQFHSGEKDHYEFWFQPKKLGRYLYLRYYAVHDESGKYLGCLEVGQDVTEIRQWQEEKRTIE